MTFNLRIDDIKYIKISFTDRNDSLNCIKATINAIKDNEIIAYTTQDKMLEAQIPQEVTIGFICSDGLYKANTTLKFVGNRGQYALARLNIPEELEYKQDREYFRVKMNLKAILKFPNEIFACNIDDISANGIRLLLDEQKEFPEKVEINILFDSKEIKTKAKFVRYDNEDDTIKASFNFINLDEQTLDFISKKCIQQQLLDKKNSLKQI